MLKTVTCVLALAAALPTVAIAGSVPERQIVRFDDLNLATPAGMERLERRIESAAREVCGMSMTRIASASEFSRGRACLAKARASAAQQVAALDRKAVPGG